MLVVGLTGGIGSGKTAASDAFACLGAAIVDTDLIAREVVEPDQPALAEISARFGDNCLTDDGRLDRRRLRDIVFSDPVAKSALEAILHPRIDAIVRRRLATLPPSTPYCIVVIPLLAETASAGGRDYLDRIVVVDVAETTQIERVMARDKVAETKARAILDTQASREQRLALADDIIDNRTNLLDLQQQVAVLHQGYMNL